MYYSKCDCVSFVQATAATLQNENDRHTGWQSATVTFDPGQHSSRRVSMQTEKQMSTVTFDPTSSSHGNRSQSGRRESDVTLDPGYHDNTAAERFKATVTFDDALGSCHGKTCSLDERPLSSEWGRSEMEGDEEELLEELGGGEDGEEEGVCDGGGGRGGGVCDGGGGRGGGVCDGGGGRGGGVCDGGGGRGGSVCDGRGGEEEGETAEDGGVLAQQSALV